MEIPSPEEFSVTGIGPDAAGRKTQTPPRTNATDLPQKTTRES